MKRKKAAALKYEKGYKSPMVTAIGFGSVAEAIIKKAEENNVPVVENDELVESLSEIELGQDIPPELYETVAKVIAFVYELNNKKNQKNGA
jgi:flagellar biosynthesis protein